MTTQNDLAVAAGASVDDDRWRAQYGDLMSRIAGRFARVETRRRAAVFVQGLMSKLPRKNCWTLAEHGGEASPAGLQHLMSRACWDHDGIRDDLRDYVVAGLGDKNAVLVVDLCRPRNYADMGLAADERPWSGGLLAVAAS